MINRITIKYLYKHTHRPKDGFHDSLLRKVADCCREHFKVAFEDGCMIVGVLDYDNPFRRIRLSCIKGFKIVDNEVAVVMEQSILFFNNSTGAIKINFRCDDDPWWKRLFSWLKPGRDGQKNGVSRNLVGINFRHPNVMPNFAVWKTITYRHWHKWCCQPRF